VIDVSSLYTRFNTKSELFPRGFSIEAKSAYDIPGPVPSFASKAAEVQAMFRSFNKATPASHTIARVRTVKVGVSKKVVPTRISANVSVSNESIV
jgi:hypothetical protein